jgi:hypothetical protein
MSGLGAFCIYKSQLMIRKPTVSGETSICVDTDHSQAMSRH